MSAPAWSSKPVAARGKPRAVPPLPHAVVVSWAPLDAAAQAAFPPGTGFVVLFPAPPAGPVAADLQAYSRSVSRRDQIVPYRKVILVSREVARAFQQDDFGRYHWSRRRKQWWMVVDPADNPETWSAAAATKPAKRAIS